jgi:hypothetical protein
MLEKLVFDVDEVGISDWEAWESKKNVVPSPMAERSIHHRINRTSKDVSVVTRISTAGE